jgi:trehalose-6-phosphate synthase
MPVEERRARHQTLMKTLRANDLDHWGDEFLKALTSGPPAVAGDTVAPDLVLSRTRTRTAGPQVYPPDPTQEESEDLPVRLTRRPS